MTENLSVILSLHSSVQGHDFIDSIMFIYYYGKNVKSWKDLGGNIVIIGAGFSIFAQTLTVILVLLRGRRMRKNNAFFPITMNLLVMLFLSNLLFIVGVQSNKNALRCEMIALLLHYLYLTTSVWCFVFIFIIYDLIINESLRLKMKFILLMAYVGPAIYVMVSDEAFLASRGSSQSPFSSSRMPLRRTAWSTRNTASCRSAKT
jgi:cytochrome c biogenesis factor